MIRKAFVAFLVLASCSLAYAQRVPTPPDSFLRYRVNSIEQFIAQVQEDPVIRQRMAKHFHVSQDELLSYLRENLRVVTVPASGRYTVYGVTRTGRIYRSSSYLRRGWRAYGLENGTLLFKWSCGNPMTTNLPKQEVAAVIEEVPPLPVAPPVLEQAPIQIPVEPPAMAMTPAQEWSYPSAPQLPATPVYQVAPLIQTAALRMAPGWLAAVPLLGAFHRHHPPPPVVPEPGTLVLMAAGVSVLALRRRRAR